MTVYMLYSKTNGHKDAYEQHFHTRKEAEKMRRKKETEYKNLSEWLKDNFKTEYYIKERHDVILLKRPGMFGRVIPVEPAEQLALF